MRGKNYGICHSCRLKGHFFAECPNKRPCPWCTHAFLKCFEVEKNTENKGKLFETCSLKCGYWEWVKKTETGAESSSVTNIRDLSCMFETRCRLTGDEDMEIAMNVTISKRGERVTKWEKNGQSSA